MIELEADLDVFGHERLEARQLGFDAVDDFQRRSFGAFGDRDVNRASAIDQSVAGQNVAAIFDHADIAHVNIRPAACADRQIGQLTNVAHDAVHRRQPIQIARAHVARRQNRVARRDGFGHFFRRHRKRTQTIRVNANDDRALVAAERRGRRHARQSREGRTHAEEREVLNFGHAARLAGKDELADGHAARVESHHERIDRARRHERFRPFNVGDDLRQRLAHISARMKEEFEQRDVLNRTRFDVLDAGDVEEVIFVIRSEKALHLRRIHSAVRLRDVDHRQIEIRKDVHRHSRDGKY
ncbi:MAG: hypothetical protein JMDDDDMK_05050 [Acidobacteria bacterium]|nr:hypothetical protein [Acidobacteriota bacterium]